MEESEGQTDDQREGEHGNDRGPELAGRRFNQHRSHDGARAGERHEHERQGHEEDAHQSALIGIAVALIDHPARERDLERSEERGGKDHEDDEEDDVGKPVRREPVENIGCHGIAAHDAGDEDDCGDGQRIEQHDEKPEYRRLDPSGSRRAAPLHKEGYGHGHHREHTGGHQRGETPQDRLDNQAPERLFTLGTGGRNLFGGRLGIADRDAELPVLGRVAVVLLAGAPVDIALQHTALAGEFDLLTEDDLVVIVAHLDLENIVVLPLGGVHLDRIADELQPRGGFERQDGGRIVRMEVVGVPSGE